MTNQKNVNKKELHISKYHKTVNKEHFKYMQNHNLFKYNKIDAMQQAIKDQL